MCVRKKKKKERDTDHSGEEQNTKMAASTSHRINLSSVRNNTKKITAELAVVVSHQLFEVSEIKRKRKKGSERSEPNRYLSDSPLPD